jgi:hypothetical protein
MPHCLIVRTRRIFQGNNDGGGRGDAPLDEEGYGSDTGDLETAVGTGEETENYTGTMSLETGVRPRYRESVRHIPVFRPDEPSRGKRESKIRLGIKPDIAE